MTNEEKARYEELEAKDCLVDDEEVIDYYRLRCEILEERLEELEKENQRLEFKHQNQVKSIDSLLEENKELKSKYNDLMLDFKMFDFNTLKQENEKLKKVIEILKELGNLHLVKEVNGKDIYYAIVFNGLYSYLEETEYNNFKEVLGDE